MWMHPHTNKLMEINTNTPEAKQPASAGCHPTTCSPSSFFPVDMLKRAIMADDAAEKFRRESKQTLLRDPETQAVVEYYQHPDGRVLIASIRIPENAEVRDRSGSGTPKQNQTL
jgi:hypothetical protein